VVAFTVEDVPGAVDAAFFFAIDSISFRFKKLFQTLLISSAESAAEVVVPVAIVMDGRGVGKIDETIFLIYF
jgi:hypothetical protein